MIYDALESKSSGKWMVPAEEDGNKYRWPPAVPGPGVSAQWDVLCADLLSRRHLLFVPDHHMCSGWHRCVTSDNRCVYFLMLCLSGLFPRMPDLWISSCQFWTLGVFVLRQSFLVAIVLEAGQDISVSSGRSHHHGLTICDGKQNQILFCFWWVTKYINTEM